MSRISQRFAVLSLTLLATLALAGPATEMWREYLRQSAVCVAGKWTSVVAESTEAGVNHYRCELEVEQVIAGMCAEKKITLSFVRIESKAQELPYLKEGERCIVFLKRGAAKEDAPWLLADKKWGLQPFSEELARQIGDAQEGRKAENGKGEGGWETLTPALSPGERSAFPARPEKIHDAADEKLVGRWLLTMPAGFEYEARFERAGCGENGLAHYRLNAEATNLRGVYEFQDGRLTLIKADVEKMAGLAWEIKNKNVVLLVEHPNTAHVGTDYRNATLTKGKPQRIAEVSGG